jgi:RNA exonuclease 4
MSASNKGIILTKKQQRLLKERRRKKKLAADDVEGRAKDDEVAADSSYDQQQPQQHAEQAAVRTQEQIQPGDPTETATEETSTIKSGTKRKRQSDTTATATATTTTATTIYIPDDIYDNAKAVKKFRKEARRDAKRGGASDAALVKLKFLKESDRPTRKFPVLKELVQEQQERNKKQLLAEDQQTQHQQQQDKEASSPTSATTTTIVDTSKYVALDCEMVGIGTDGKKSVLARASLVDWHGHCIYDRYVQVPVHVTDFRTKFSGIKPTHLKDKKHGAVSPNDCRKDIATLLKNKILVGHALHNDLEVLLLQHNDVRDTAKYRPFQRLSYAGQYRPRKLKDLVAEHLQQTIQVGSHDSVQDAAAAMALYQVVHVEWEREVALQLAKKNKNQTNSHRRGGKKA